MCRAEELVYLISDILFTFFTFGLLPYAENCPKVNSVSNDNTSSKKFKCKRSESHIMRKDVFKRRIRQRIAENNPHHELVSKFDTFLYHSIFVVVMNDGFVWLDTHKVLHLLQASNYKRSVLTYSEKFNWMLPLQ